MLPFIITYFLLGLVSAVLIYGLWLAYFQGEFPFIAEQEYSLDVRDAIVNAFITLLLWPVMLIVVLTEVDWGKHGLLFTNPHKKKDMITKCEKCNFYSCRCQQIDFISKPKEQRCAECGGMFLQEKMYLLEFKDLTFHHSNSESYYCVSHKRPYDIIKLWPTGNNKYFKTIPAHEVEVDVNGVEIKKKGGK